MKKKKSEASDAAIYAYGIVRKIRGDWNGVIPITKVIPNKKKNKQEKHKGRMYDYD